MTGKALTEMSVEELKSYLDEVELSPDAQVEWLGRILKEINTRS